VFLLFFLHFLKVNLLIYLRNVVTGRGVLGLLRVERKGLTMFFPNETLFLENYKSSEDCFFAGKVSLGKGEQS
jgi:hypothetical protein